MFVTPSARTAGRARIPLATNGAAALFAIAALSPCAFAQLRIVNYNVAQLNGDTEALRDVFAALNDDDKTGVAIAPHLYIMQEVESGDVGPILGLLESEAPPGVNYELASYTNLGENLTGGAQALYYREDVLGEDDAAHLDIFTGGGRFADRWRLCLDGYASSAACFYVYGMHLKAGSATEDAAERHTGAIAVRDDADTLPLNTHIVYAGDFNISINTELAYSEFFLAGIGQAIDPLGTGSWAGSGQAIKHTQSPLFTPVGPLIGGGMDDRYDFQLPGTKMNDGAGLSLLAGTYRAFGNDGNHYNTDINSGNNTYYPGDIPRSNAVADALNEASDHIPVVAEYKIPGFLAATLPSDFGRVIQGAAHQIQLTAWNDADVLVAAGADTLLYSAAATGALSGSAFGFLAPLGPAAVTGINVNSATVGPVAGLCLVSSSSQGTTNVALNSSGTIVRASNPSFLAGSDQDSVSLVWDLGADIGVQTIHVPVHNFGWDSLQALLDVESATGASSPLTFAGGLAPGIGSGSATLAFDFDTDSAAPGLHAYDIEIETSDEDLPGEMTRVIDLHIDVTIGSAPCPADLDGSGDVGFGDLTTLLIAWGACPACPEDLDGSGDVGFGDLTTLLLAWGPCPP